MLNEREVSHAGGVRTIVCGRFAQTSAADDLARFFDIGEPPPPPRGRKGGGRFNISITDAILAAREEEGRRAWVWTHWGFLPSWTQRPLFNARRDKLVKSNTWKTAFRRRRCLIPATGFYEWPKVNGRKSKEPFHIRRKDGALFAFAGLWEDGSDASGEVRTCSSIVTTEPNELMKPIHDRMPVILAPDEFARWLDAGNEKPGELLPFLEPRAWPAFEAYRVSPYVNRAGQEGLECVAPLKTPPQQPTLF